MKQKVEIEVDVPDGYEFVRYGIPEDGELVLLNGGGGILPAEFCKENYVILRKVKQWREPVLPADYGKEARFSDDGKRWKEGRLAGWYKDGNNDNLPWVSATIHGYKFCQVCDEETK